MRRYEALLSSLFFFAGLAACGQGPSFRTEIRVTQPEVWNNQTFMVDTAIRNTGTAEQSVDVWTCSYASQWSADNPAVVVDDVACMQNVHGIVSLKPGTAYERTVPVHVEFAAGKGTGESITFRLGYEDATQVKVARPFPDNPPIWSNAVTIGVTRHPSSGNGEDLANSNGQPLSVRSFVSTHHCVTTNSKHPLVSPRALSRGTQVSLHASDMRHDQRSHTSSGTVTIKNVSANTVAGPFHLVLDSLTSDVTMSNASGYFGCLPYITFTDVPSLAPGQTATVKMQFSNPRWMVINFVPTIYAGKMDGRWSLLRSANSSNACR